MPSGMMKMMGVIAVAMVAGLLALLPASAAAANPGDLCLYGAVTAATQNAMEPGTSPAITEESDGSAGIAYESSSQQLNYYSAGTNTNTGYAMEPDANPSLSATHIAFIAPNDELMTAYGSSEVATGQFAAPGTSPAVASVSGGDVYVYNNTNLNLVTGDGTTWTAPGLGTDAGSSPAIAAVVGGGWQASFLANSAAMWEYDSAENGTDTGQGMNAGGSPAETALGTSGDFDIAFESDGNQLFFWGSNGDANTGSAMAPDTNPAITGIDSGNDVVIAFQGPNGDLWLYGDTGNGTFDTGLAMAPSTSPAITETSSGYEVAYQCAAAATATPAPTLTVTTTTPAPATTSTTPASAPGRKKSAPRVRVRFTLDAHWNGRSTHLTYVRPLKKLPRGVLITFTCKGITAKAATKHTKPVVAEHCPRLGKLPAKQRTIAKELAVAAGRTFPRNVVLTIAVAVKGYRTELIAIKLTARGKHPPESVSWK